MRSIYIYTCITLVFSKIIQLKCFNIVALVCFNNVIAYYKRSQTVLNTVRFLYNSALHNSYTRFKKWCLHAVYTLESILGSHETELITFQNWKVLAARYCILCMYSPRKICTLLTTFTIHRSLRANWCNNWCNNLRYDANNKVVYIIHSDITFLLHDVWWFGIYWLFNQLESTP